MSLEESSSEGQRSTYRDGADVSAPPKKSCTVPVFARGARAWALLAEAAEDADIADSDGTALKAVAMEDGEIADAMACVSKSEMAIVWARVSVIDSHTPKGFDTGNETSTSTPSFVKDVSCEAWSE